MKTRRGTRGKKLRYWWYNGCSVATKSMICQAQMERATLGWPRFAEVTELCLSLPRRRTQPQCSSVTSTRSSTSSSIHAHDSSLFLTNIFLLDIGCTPSSRFQHCPLVLYRPTSTPSTVQPPTSRARFRLAHSGHNDGGTEDHYRSVFCTSA